MLPQRGTRPEPGPLRDLVDRQIGRLEQVPGVVDALLDQPGSGRAAGLLPKAPVERAAAHPGLGRQAADVQRAIEMTQGPLARVGRALLVRCRHRPVDELSLAALAPGRDYAVARGGIGDGAAVVAPDDVQAEVD